LTKTHPGCGFSTADQLQEQVSLTDIFNSYRAEKTRQVVPETSGFKTDWYHKERTHRLAILYGMDVLLSRD
jgi:hypothetical protein